MKEKEFFIEESGGNIYKTGYVAFIDILGFSKFINIENKCKSCIGKTNCNDKEKQETDVEAERNNNALLTKELFTFVDGLKEIFKKNTDLGIEMFYFSDSIILATESDDYQILQIPIKMIEASVYDKLKCLLRGGIVYGQYYIDDKFAFGPAIVDAYKIEEAAKYPRIVIDSKIPIYPDDLDVFKDFDGKNCLNNFAFFLNELKRSVDDINDKNAIINKAIETLKIISEDIWDGVLRYEDTSVADKYYWRIRPYNHMCEMLAEHAEEWRTICDIELVLNEEEKDLIKGLKINLQDAI